MDKSKIEKPEEGWTIFPGGECPVKGYEVIQVKFRDTRIPASYCQGSDYQWTRKDGEECDTDIVAYRVVSDYERRRYFEDDFCQ